MSRPCRALSPPLAIHTHSSPISSPKVLISSSLSRLLALRIRKKNTVYTVAPRLQVHTTTFSLCGPMLADGPRSTSSHQHYGRNYLVFFLVHLVECLSSAKLGHWPSGFKAPPPLTPFSLTIRCLFVPWLPARQSSPLNRHQQLHLQLWDDPMPKLLVAQAHVARPGPDPR
jgi:hypothetical protein